MDRMLIEVLAILLYQHHNAEWLPSPTKLAAWPEQGAEIRNTYRARAEAIAAAWRADGYRPAPGAPAPEQPVRTPANQDRQRPAAAAFRWVADPEAGTGWHLAVRSGRPFYREWEVFTLQGCQDSAPFYSDEGLARAFPLHAPVGLPIAGEDAAP